MPFGEYPAWMMGVAESARQAKSTGLTFPFNDASRHLCELRGRPYESGCNSKHFASRRCQSCFRLNAIAPSLPGPCGDTGCIEQHQSGQRTARQIPVVAILPIALVYLLGPPMLQRAAVMPKPATPLPALDQKPFLAQTQAVLPPLPLR
jgi:hypothetical protein